MDLTAPSSFAACLRVSGLKGDYAYAAWPDGTWSVTPRPRAPIGLPADSGRADLHLAPAWQAALRRIAELAKINKDGDDA